MLIILTITNREPTPAFDVPISRIIAPQESTRSSLGIQELVEAEKALDLDSTFDLTEL